MDMLKKIQELSFMAIELTLYLDTHPHDQNALAHYNIITQQLNALKQSYEQRHGPFIAYGFSPSAYPWQYINEPWPWQIEY
ncbi:spore coat protein CotJB [Caldanaerobius polysaccharolyticus]|uniref:spore coat protein CotJB n=1 Tax=Caldanaerobius polysaccharolyticus TaxID=44256 RepID=UPI00047CB4C4|nr:spore coat protein CotJB [Caldanaerobius polysaccharolyticus]